MSDIRSKFGGARIGGFARQYKDTKISDKTNNMAFRIFPAMHSLTASERWYFFHPVHFGYKVYDDPKTKDINNLRHRPFRCVEETDRRTDMVTVSCAECREIEAQQKALDDLTAAETARLKQQGILDEKKIEEMLKPLLAPLKKWFSDHNLDKKFYMNAIDEKGEFHVLRMGSRAKQALEAKIKELRERGFEPIADFDGGVYFQFTVTGKGNQTQTAVNVATMQDPNNKLAMIMKIAPLSDAALEKAYAVLPDLTTVQRVVTPEQVKMLVESKGDPDVVQIVMDMSNRVQRESSPARQASSLPTPTLPTQATPPVPVPTPAAPVPQVQQQQVTAPPVPAPVSAPPQAAAVAAPAVEDEEAAMVAKLEALRAKKAAQAAQVAPPTPAPTPSGNPTADPLDPNMSPEQFAATFGPPPQR